MVSGVAAQPCPTGLKDGGSGQGGVGCRPPTHRKPLRPIWHGQGRGDSASRKEVLMTSFMNSARALSSSPPRRSWASSSWMARVPAVRTGRAAGKTDVGGLRKIAELAGNCVNCRKLRTSITSLGDGGWAWQDARVQFLFGPYTAGGAWRETAALGGQPIHTCQFGREEMLAKVGAMLNREAGKSPSRPQPMRGPITTKQWAAH